MKTFMISTVRACLLLLVATCFQTLASAQELSLNLATMTKYLDGVPTSQDLSTRTDIAAIGIKDQNSAYYFTSDAGFENWARTQPGGAAAADRNHALANINAFAEQKGYQDLPEGATIPYDLQNVIETEIPGTTAAAAGGVIFGCTFYDYPIFQGPKKTCLGPFYFTLGDFRNRAESVKGVGILTLVTFCDKKWFGKPRTSVFSSVGFSVINFNDWNNRIESYFTN